MAGCASAGSTRGSHQRLYEAIGERDSRYCRSVPARQAIERLMLLDAVLTSPDLEWLTTESEKLAHVARLNRQEAVNHTPDPASDTLPTTPAPPIVSLPGRFPIGLDIGGRALLLYLALQPWTDEFRTWLQGHVAVLHRLSAWTLCLVFPQPLDRV